MGTPIYDKHVLKAIGKRVVNQMLITQRRQKGNRWKQNKLRRHTNASAAFVNAGTIALRTSWIAWLAHLLINIFVESPWRAGPRTKSVRLQDHSTLALQTLVNAITKAFLARGMASFATETLKYVEKA